MYRFQRRRIGNVVHIDRVDEEWKDPEDAQPMKPTPDWMSRKFDVFNSRFFGGKLPKPEFKADHLGIHTLGKFCFSKQLRWNKATRMPVDSEPHPDNPYRMTCDLTKFGPTIVLNNEMARTEHFLEQTLIHEMVHWYVDWRGCVSGAGFPTQGHGWEFKNVAARIMSECNGDYQITTRTNTSAENLVKDDRLMNAQERADARRKAQKCAVIWIKRKDGVEGFVLAFPGSLWKMLNEIGEMGRILSKYESVKFCDDGDFGNKVKNMKNFTISRKYTGYYDFKKYPEVRDLILANSGKFRQYDLGR